MSLINDLLRDLEARQANTCAADGFAGLDMVPDPRRPARRWRSVSITALLLIASSAGAVWLKDAPTIEPTSFVLPARTHVQPTAPLHIAPAAAPVRLLGLSSSLSMRPLSKAPAAVPPVQASPAAPSTVDAAALDRPAAVHQEPAPELTTETQRQVPVKATDHRAAGLFALSQGQGAAAEAHFRELLLRDASDTDSWLNLGFALRQQGRHSEAEERISAALSSAARPALLAQSLARDLVERGADAEALKILLAYRPEAELDPIHDAFIAAVLQRVGQHDKAADMYRSILAVRPQASDWWVGLAISEEALGLERQAIKAYRHAQNIGNLDTTLARYAQQRITAIEGKQKT